MTINETAQTIGERIGKAIARDTKANPEYPREWTGIEAQDADQIPDGIDRKEVEAVAERVYREEMK